MAAKRCVYPGSFDPVTNGHVDIIERASVLFDEVVVAVLHNPVKTGLFPVDQRMTMLAQACAHLPNVRFDSFDGLLVDYMRKTGADVVIRGLRGISDFESETRMAQLNRQLNERVETLFFSTDPEYANISSSVVREIGMFGGDISGFVPSCIAQEVVSILRQR